VPSIKRQHAVSQFDFCAITRLRSWSNDATMRRSDQFPFRHFDRPKPPVRCGPILVTGANYSSGSLDPFDILSPNDCCLRTADVRGVDFECALSAPLAHRSDAAQVFRAAVSAKVSGD
jgi:hypothetical protein